jgi:hypothetical protein
LEPRVLKAQPVPAHKARQVILVHKALWVIPAHKEH